MQLILAVYRRGMSSVAEVVIVFADTGAKADDTRVYHRASASRRNQRRFSFYADSGDISPSGAAVPHLDDYVT